MSANKKVRTALAAIVIDELTSLLLNIPSLVFSIGACAAQPSYLLHWVPHVIREEHLRIPLYYERWISNYMEMDFYKLFRMTSVTCNLLTAEIGKIMIAQEHHGGRESVPVRKQVLMTLWYLAKGDTLISIADRFNVAQSTVCDRVHYVISLMVDLLPKFIVWPSELESRTIIEEFKNISNYPGIMGAVDGCNIICKVPSEQQDSYQDRKFHHSVKLQGICTPHKIFINVCIGFPGSVHDARVLRESSIGKAIERDGHVKWFYLPENHLIGDSAYPLKTWLMKPYRDYGNLNITQRRHNKSLNSARVLIENVFGLLKGRWRILQHVNVYKIEYVSDIIAAACMLHNFCLLNKDQFDDVLEMNNLPQDERAQGQFQIDNAAIDKRDNICATLT